MNSKQTFLALAVLTSLTSAAGCSRSEPAPADKASEPGPAPAAKVAEPPKPAIDDTTFRLALTGASAYEAGKLGEVELTLEARGGYHVNQDYPLRVDVKAPAGVKLEKSSFGKPDAAQFGEERARFVLPFKADPGAHDLTATVDFAVCTKDTCVPDSRTVALPLAVR